MQSRGHSSATPCHLLWGDGGGESANTMTGLHFWTFCVPAILKTSLTYFRFAHPNSEVIPEGFKRTCCWKSQRESKGLVRGSPWLIMKILQAFEKGSPCQKWPSLPSQLQPPPGILSRHLCYHLQPPSREQLHTHTHNCAGGQLWASQNLLFLQGNGSPGGSFRFLLLYLWGRWFQALWVKFG